MDTFISNISITVNEKIYLKDPSSSTLGKKILEGSIDMIEELGFEQFTFRKLSTSIKSTEASIYRYFENKHKILLFLTCWYWGWQEYRLVFGLANMQDSEEKLKRAIEILTGKIELDNSYTHINEKKLYNIIVAEASKVYLTKAVDDENKDGVFRRYKSIVQRVSDIILEINPSYKYPHMLVSTAIETALHQRFFALHLPKLTDIYPNEDPIVAFCQEMTLKAIQ